MPFQSQSKESALRQPGSAVLPATASSFNIAGEHELACTTAFPNMLLDEVMPALKDTEWRLLCVVVRQTLGWQQQGRRKRRDWLTQRQLIAKTNRNSQAVSRAVDALVRQGLLEVQDQCGNVLLTPAERRRHGGRLYYRLGARLSLVGASKGARGDAVDVATDKAALKITQGTMKSPVGKSHTTKTTGTKYLSYDKAAAFPFKIKEFVGNARKQRSPREKSQPAVKTLLHHYRDLFQQRSPVGEPPPIAWGRDGKIAKDLLQVYSLSRLEALMQQFFASADPWLKKRGYTLAAFRDAVPALLMEDSLGASNHALQPNLRTGQWTPVGQVRSLRNKTVSSHQYGLQRIDQWQPV
ncbi:MAG: replication protein [Abitibacteriaceae bacterium]|nr:replication protein [Abditibacteriaceae bacterium]